VLSRMLQEKSNIHLKIHAIFSVSVKQPSWVEIEMTEIADEGDPKKGRNPKGKTVLDQGRGQDQGVEIENGQDLPRKAEK